MRISDWSSDVCSSDLGLPHLVRAGSLGVELIGGLYHDIGRTGDQIVRLEQAVNRGFRYEVALLVGEAHRQFAGAEIGRVGRSEEHTSELQSLMRISYAVFCLKKKKLTSRQTNHNIHDKLQIT